MDWNSKQASGSGLDMETDKIELCHFIRLFPSNQAGHTIFDSHISLLATGIQNFPQSGNIQNSDFVTLE